MKKLLLALAIVAMTYESASAVFVLSDNFDSYADTAAFTAVWPVVGAQPTGTIVTDRFVSSPNSVHVIGTTVTASSQRNGRSFTETDTYSSDGVGGSNLPIGDKITWSFDFYDSPTVIGNPQRNYANLQDSTAPGASPAAQLISMGLNNNQNGGDSGGNYYMARILGFAHTAVDPDGGPNEAASGTASGAYFKLNDFGTGLRSTGWHNLKVVLSTDNGTSLDMNFFVDNSLAESVLNIGDAGALRSYDHIRIGSGLSNGGVDANFDNMSLVYTAIPEAGSFVTAGFTGFFAICLIWLGNRRGLKAFGL